MIVIGLCGGTGSGKSTVSYIFHTYGVEILDADVIYHEITSYMSDCLMALREAFGDSIIKENRLDRSSLAALVFQGERREQNRKLLNSITHKYVQEEIERRIRDHQSCGVEKVLLDVPLLFESDIDKICDILVCVTAPLEVRIERLMARDGITREHALARINAQLDDAFLITHTHFHIVNDNSLMNAEEQVEIIMKNIDKRQVLTNG